MKEKKTSHAVSYFLKAFHIFVSHFIHFGNQIHFSGFGSLEVACWLLVPKFAGSNPAEAVGFFRAKKSSARLPLEGK
jgi:hypothetical protein